ncbi:MAG: methionyl-tRNA formyltransferase [Phycisphaerae bacterium]|nr:methionyl-tRNA formyltransferase [Phycisphaerae bacterium]
MRVVFFGAGDFAVPSLRWLGNSPHEVVLVVTQPDRPAGRGKQLLPTPVAARAAQDGMHLVRCEDVNTTECVESLRRLRPDLGVVIDFGQKLRAEVRSVFPSACINLHGSLLPKYRGAAPVAHAILSGERKTGVSVFRLVDRMDAGPVLVQRETAIGPYETQEELHGRLAAIGCDAMDAAFKLFSGDRLPEGKPQDEAQATRAPKLSKADGLLRFHEPAESIARRCRALWPWPGARCQYVGSEGRPVEVTLISATATPVPVDAPPGTVTPILTVATGSGTLEIHSLQPAGKRPMGWQDFVNGRHVQAGCRFVSLGA